MSAPTRRESTKAFPIPVKIVCVAVFLLLPDSAFAVGPREEEAGAEGKKDTGWTRQKRWARLVTFREPRPAVTDVSLQHPVIQPMSSGSSAAVMELTIILRPYEKMGWVAVSSRPLCSPVLFLVTVLLLRTYCLQLDEKEMWNVL